MLKKRRRDEERKGNLLEEYLMAKVVEWSQGLEDLSNGERNKEIIEGEPSQPERNKTVRWFGDFGKYLWENHLLANF